MFYKSRVKAMIKNLGFDLYGWPPEVIDDTIVSAKRDYNLPAFEAAVLVYMIYTFSHALNAAQDNEVAEMQAVEVAKMQAVQMAEVKLRMHPYGNGVKFNQVAIAFDSVVARSST